MSSLTGGRWMTNVGWAKKAAERLMSELGWGYSDDTTNPNQEGWVKSLYTTKLEDIRRQYRKRLEKCGIDPCAAGLKRRRDNSTGEATAADTDERKKQKLLKEHAELNQKLQKMGVPVSSDVPPLHQFLADQSADSKAEDAPDSIWVIASNPEAKSAMEVAGVHIFVQAEATADDAKPSAIVKTTDKPSSFAKPSTTTQEQDYNTPESHPVKIVAADMTIIGAADTAAKSADADTTAIKSVAAEPTTPDAGDVMPESSHKHASQQDPFTVEMHDENESDEATIDTVVPSDEDADSTIATTKKKAPSKPKKKKKGQPKKKSTAAPKGQPKKKYTAAPKKPSSKSSTSSNGTVKVGQKVTACEDLSKFKVTEQSKAFLKKEYLDSLLYPVKACTGDPDELKKEGKKCKCVGNFVGKSDVKIYYHKDAMDPNNPTILAFCTPYFISKGDRVAKANEAENDGMRKSRRKMAKTPKAKEDE